MTVLSFRIAVPLSALALLGLSSCSKPAPPVASARPADFYWSAARETWAVADYVKTADHLDRLIEAHNEFTVRAVPWALVLNAGMAEGYIDLADHYAAGARARKTDGLEFYRKASEYRAAASTLALRAAQMVDKLDQLPAGSVQLAFEVPNGNPAPSVLLGKIAKGIALSPPELEEVRATTVQRGVLLAACRAAGAPDDIARTEHLLSRATALTPRATFAGALAQMLNREATLYSRDKLDEPVKLASMKQRAQTVMAWAKQQPGVALAMNPRR